MDTNRIQHLISKIYEILSDKRTKSDIDIDLMLDYTRVMYADMLALKKEINGVAQFDLENLSKAASAPNIESTESAQEIQSAQEPIVDTKSDYASTIFIEIPESIASKSTKDNAIIDTVDVQDSIPETDQGEIYNAGTAAAPVEPTKPEPTNIPTEKKDVRKLIGINDKYLFMNELFHNDKFDYESVLDFINESKDLKAVELWLDKEYIQNKKWNPEDSTVALFYGVATKHFSNFK